MKYLITLLITFSLGLCLGQYQDDLILRKSSKKTVTSSFGFGKVEIVHGAPKQKGRVLWGSLIPYGEVWRLGADEATTITVSTSFYLNNNLIKPGKYAMFLKPNESGTWEFILNYQSEQWGAYDYNDSLDVAVLAIQPIEVTCSKENLTLDFEEYEEGKANLSIQWGTKLLLVQFSVDVLDQFLSIAQKTIDATSQTERWAAYLQAAEYLANEATHTQQALNWIKRAQKEYKKFGDKWAQNSNDYYEGHILWTQAKIFAVMGKHKKALKIAKIVTENSSPTSFYSYENDPERENIDAIMSGWKD